MLFARIREARVRVGFAIVKISVVIVLLAPSFTLISYYHNDGEYFAVIKVRKIVSLYLISNWLIVQTEHKTLKWLLTILATSEKLARKRLQSSEFESDMYYRSGIKLQAADGLLWLPTDGTNINILNDKIFMLIISTDILTTNGSNWKQITWQDNKAHRKLGCKAYHFKLYELADKINGTETSNPIPRVFIGV